MPTEALVALIGGVCVVAAAWIGRPTVASHKRLKRIEEHTEKTGNGFAAHVLDGLDDIKESQAHLIGRFDQHLIDSDSDKKAAADEARQMWSAIEAVAKATPPEGD